MTSPMMTAQSEPMPPLPPPTLVPPPRPPKRPALALFLSLLMPGVGQLYNGQVTKAFAFFTAFVAAIYLTGDVGMPFPLFIPFLIFYGLIDAYRSASLINARWAGRAAAEPEADDTDSPAWGATILGLGVLLLFNNLGIFRIAALQRFWPLVLIVAGAFFLYRSLQRRKGPDDGAAL